jgi:multidrug transporter EmrE-like cation transporter
MKFAYLALSVAFNVGSYGLYKSISHRQTGLRWFAVFFLGLVLGSVNVFFFARALREIDLNIAYPVFSGACIFFMTLLSCLFFGEKVTVNGLVGGAFVIVGIALMSQ